MYARALRDRSMYVQSAASQALAEYGDARATTEMLAWVRRKLRRKNWAATLDYEEVRAPLRFATRNGASRVPDTTPELEAELQMEDQSVQEALARAHRRAQRMPRRY